MKLLAHQIAGGLPVSGQAIGSLSEEGEKVERAAVSKESLSSSVSLLRFFGSELQPFGLPASQPVTVHTALGGSSGSSISSVAGKAEGSYPLIDCLLAATSASAPALYPKRQLHQLVDLSHRGSNDCMPTVHRWQDRRLQWGKRRAGACPRSSSAPYQLPCLWANRSAMQRGVL